MGESNTIDRTERELEAEAARRREIKEPQETKNNLTVGFFQFTKNV